MVLRFSTVAEVTPRIPNALSPALMVPKLLTVALLNSRPFSDPVTDAPDWTVMELGLTFLSPYPTGVFRLPVVPVQLTFAPLTGVGGSHAAAARSIATNGAISSAGAITSRQPRSIEALRLAFSGPTGCALLLALALLLVLASI